MINKIEENIDNRFAVIGKDLAIESMGDKILVLEDDWTSGYECEVCKGSCVEVGAPVCGWCMGTRVDSNGESKCRICGGSGVKPCVACRGKGVKAGGLVIPDDAKRRPSTGRVVSCGPAVLSYKPDDHVLYTNFSGTLVELRQGQKLRFLREHEIMGKMYGRARVNEVIKDS